MGVEYMQVTSYKDLLKLLSSIGCNYPYTGTFFYRGLPDNKLDLIPPLYYPPTPKDPRDKEIKILNSFIDNTSFWVESNPNERVWHNAFYSRHWGLKSRLIDWTIDLSVALYFMLQNSQPQNTAALFVLPKNHLPFLTEVPNTSYYDYTATVMLNPHFKLEDVFVIGSKNRFIQNGRFLIQDYGIAHECFYKRNLQAITKIEIPQVNLQKIFEECCDDRGLDPTVPLVLKLNTDPYYNLCEELNKL